jgi:hypothetical protein
MQMYPEISRRYFTQARKFEYLANIRKIIRKSKSLPAVPPLPPQLFPANSRTAERQSQARPENGHVLCPPVRHASVGQIMRPQTIRRAAAFLAADAKSACGGLRNLITICAIPT